MTRVVIDPGVPRPRATRVRPFWEMKAETRQAGSSADVFLMEQLAPLIKRGTAIYDELRRNVFGDRGQASPTT